MNEKDMDTEVINGVMLAETIREISCPCPWCAVVPEKSFRWGKQDISAVILFFGKKDSWDYHDVRRLIVSRLTQEKPELISKALGSYPSFLNWLNQK